MAGAIVNLRPFLHPDVHADFDAILEGHGQEPASQLWPRIMDRILVDGHLRLTRRWRVASPRLLPVLLEEILCHQEYFFECDRPDPRIIDAGANIGLAIYYFRRVWPNCRIEAFEPSPHVAAILAQNLTQQGYDGVHLHQAGLADRDGTADFFASEAEDPASTFCPERAPADSVRMPVPLCDIRSLLEEPVDLLKLDVEGMELPILAAAGDRLRACRNLICETHADGRGGNTLSGILPILDTQGFAWAVARSLWDEAQPRLRFARHLAKRRSYVVFARRRD